MPRTTPSIQHLTIDAGGRLWTTNKKGDWLALFHSPNAPPNTGPPFNTLIFLEFYGGFVGIQVWFNINYFNLLWAGMCQRKLEHLQVSPFLWVSHCCLLTCGGGEGAGHAFKSSFLSQQWWKRKNMERSSKIDYSLIDFLAEIILKKPLLPITACAMYGQVFCVWNDTLSSHMSRSWLNLLTVTQDWCRATGSTRSGNQQNEKWPLIG